MESIGYATGWLATLILLAASVYAFHYQDDAERASRALALGVIPLVFLTVYAFFVLVLFEWSMRGGLPQVLETIGGKLLAAFVVALLLWAIVRTLVGVWRARSWALLVVGALVGIIAIMELVLIVWRGPSSYSIADTLRSLVAVALLVTVGGTVVTILREKISEAEQADRKR